MIGVLGGTTHDTFQGCDFEAFSSQLGPPVPNHPLEIHTSALYTESTPAELTIRGEKDFYKGVSHRNWCLRVW